MVLILAAFLRWVKMCYGDGMLLTRLKWLKSGSQLIFLYSLLFGISPMAHANLEIALTVDDLPSASAELNPGQWKVISDKMLATLKKHRIQGVYGFVNSKPIEKTPMLSEILGDWIRAGHFLGNHTFSHADIDQLSTSEYSKEISTNETILKTWMGNRDFKYFRFPYLAEGETREKRDRIRGFLFKNGYQVAPVTMDFFDYEWGDPYLRCTAKSNQDAMKWLRESYVEQALNGMEIGRLLSNALFGREIKYILLIHIGLIQAEVLDPLLSAFEAKGARFISLPTALADEVYRIDPKIARKRSYTFLNQIRLSRGIPNPKRVSELYGMLPEEKLSQICK